MGYIEASEMLYWQKSALERSDKAFMTVNRLGPVEVRPVPQRMTDTERMAWQREYCNGWYYVKPTRTVSGHYVVTDSMGEETRENNLDDAIEMAAEKFRRANGE